MALKNLVVPWLSGGALLLGYAAFNWLRGPRASRLISKTTPPTADDNLHPTPLKPSSEAKPMPELVLDLSEIFETQATSVAPRQKIQLGSLFLGRASETLSAVAFDADGSIRG